MKRFPAGDGRRVPTFAHLLCGEPEAGPAATLSGPAAVSAEQIVLEEEASWRKKLEDEVAALRAELKTVREELTEFRKEFDPSA